MSEEWFTVAEAAQRLGVPERSLRRVIARAPFAERTRQEARETRTGTRQAVLVPSALMADLTQHFARWETRSEGGQGNTAGTRHNADSPDSVTRSEPGLLTAYERMLSDKDREIARLEANLLTTQEQLGKALDALAREQTLRALLPAPQAKPESETASPQEQEEEPRAWWQIWKR